MSLIVEVRAITKKKKEFVVSSQVDRYVVARPEATRSDEKGMQQLREQ